MGAAQFPVEWPVEFSCGHRVRVAQFANFGTSALTLRASTSKPMEILMDKTLAEYADQAYEAPRLGRNGVHTPRDLVSAEMLAELEAAGDAMRFVDCRGQIAWKATPQLRDYLMDLQLDAEADLEDV